jgi:hypothetical protein
VEPWIGWTWPRLKEASARFEPEGSWRPCHGQLLRRLPAIRVPASSPRQLCVSSLVLHPHLPAGQAESAATHLQSERDAVVRYLQLMRSVAEIQEAEFALTTLEQNPDHKPAEVRSAKEHLKRRADDLKVALPKFQADIDAVQARGSSRGGEGDVSWSFFDPRDAALHEALLSNRLALRKLLASSSSKTIREEKWVYDGSGWGN